MPFLQTKRMEKEEETKKMKISFKSGDPIIEGDQRIFIDSNDEQVTMIELANLINQFNLNELIRIDKRKNLNRQNHQLFPKIMKKAIQDAEDGVDWSKLSEESFLYLKDYPYFVPEETIKKFVEERE